MTDRKRVLIVNERFLPRFGVDRILILLAERLVEQGCDVQFACLRCEREPLERVSADINVLQLPEGCDFSDASCIISWRARCC